MRVDTPLPPGNDLAAVATWAAHVMQSFGLSTWQFRYNRRLTAMGLCRHGRRTIELSAHLVERNPPEEVRETLLHEIAHAIVGPGHGHDAAWRTKCREIGARPERCGQADMPLGRVVAVCGGCSRKLRRHRRPRAGRLMWCRACGPERGLLAWRLDGETATPGPAATDARREVTQ